MFAPNARVLNDYWFQQRKSSLRNGAKDPCDMSYLVDIARHRGRVADVMASADPRSTLGYIPCDNHQGQDAETNGDIVQVIEVLAKLGELQSSNLITAEEFHRLKARLLEDVAESDDTENLATVASATLGHQRFRLI